MPKDWEADAMLQCAVYRHRRDGATSSSIELDLKLPIRALGLLRRTPPPQTRTHTPAKTKIRFFEKAPSASAAPNVRA